MDAMLARLEDAEQRGDVDAVVAELRAHGGSPAHAPVALQVLRMMLADSQANVDNRAKAAAAGAIEALLHTLCVHDTDAVIQTQALWVLSYILNADDGVAEASRRGAVDAVVAALRAHGADLQLQATGFVALSNLLYCSSDNCIAASHAGAIEAAVAALRMHKANNQLILPVAASLCHLLADERSRAFANRADVLSSFVVVMRRHGSDADLLARGCQALFFVIRGSSHDKQTLAGAAGAVEALVCALLAFPADMRIQDYGCAALRYLVADHQLNAAKAGACGAVEAVTALLRLPGTNAHVLSSGCHALARLFGDNEVCKKNLRRAVDAGAFDAVVTAVRSNCADAELATSGCLTLCSMLADGVCHQEAGRGLAADTAALVMRTHSQDANVQAAAVSFLGRLFMWLTSGSYRKSAWGGHEVALAAVLTALQSNAHVQQVGTATLFDMLTPLQNVQTLTRSRSPLEAQVHCIRRLDPSDLAPHSPKQLHPLQVRLHQLPMQCHRQARQKPLHQPRLCDLRLLSTQWVHPIRGPDMLRLGDESVQVKAAALDAFDVIMATMQVHKLDARTQARACGAVEQLIAGSPARTHDAGAAGAVGAVLSALSSHSAHAEVQLQGYQTLLTLIIADEGNAQRAIRAGALRLKRGVRNAVPELVRCRNAVMRELERAAATAAEAAAAELLASEELERGAAAAAPKPGKSKKKRGGGAGGAGGAGGNGGGQQALPTQTHDDAASAAHEQPPPHAADADDDADDAAAPSQLSALAARRRRRTATKAARRRGASTGGAEAAEAAADEAPAPDAQPAEASVAAAEDDADADDAAVPPAAQMQQLHVQPPAAAAPLLHGAAEDPESPSCVICLDAPRSVVLLPCKHLALCSAPACAAMMGAPPRCPLCRVVVVDTLVGVFL
jgi:hypothetical protein